MQKTLELLIAICSDGMKSHPHVIAIICLQTTFFRSSKEYSLAHHRDNRTTWQLVTKHIQFELTSEQGLKYTLTFEASVCLGSESQHIHTIAVGSPVCL